LIDSTGSLIPLLVLIFSTTNTVWDHGFSTEAEIEYQTSLGKENIAELSVFCPQAFANLRSTFGIAEDSYRNSMFGSGPFVSFQSNSKGAARVGGVFFFTRDGAYMIKTIKVRVLKTEESDLEPTYC
jgi:hypothetical protein